MGNDNHVVVSHKLCSFQGHVGGRLIMMKEPVVVASKFWSFSLHIFSQVSQNVTAKVSVDRSVWRNKYMMKKPIHVEKINEHALLNSRSAAPFLLLLIGGSCTATTVALFLDHNHTSNFHRLL
jgi:hypothetical protein